MTMQRTLCVSDNLSYSRKGRICVLLGALTAPGPEIARALARDGCHVILADSDLEQLRDLAASILRSGSEGPECCLIPELDKPYRDSSLAICAAGAESIVDNRESADYARHSVSRNAGTARRSVWSQPSIYFLSMPAPDFEMNALLALDLTTVVRNPALILSAQAACRLLRGKIRWYRVQKRFGEIENIIESALSHIFKKTTDDGRTAFDDSRISELIVELARGSDSARSLFRLRTDCLSKILEDHCCASAVATIAELLGTLKDAWPRWHQRQNPTKEAWSHDPRRIHHGKRIVRSATA